VLVLAHAQATHLPLLAINPLPLAGIVFASALYLNASRQLAGRGRTIPTSQRLSFTLGLALLFIATQTGLDPLGEHHLVSAHMAQHLLLADLPAPLLLYGVRSPVIVFLWPKAIVVTVARMGWLRWLWSTVRRPAWAMTIWMTVLFAWHIPVAYEVALHTQWVHDLEHLSFAFTGILAWYPVMDPLARKGGELGRALYLIAARSGGSILAIVLMVTPTQIYDTYGLASERYGIDPVSDQQLAGVLMMSVDFCVIVIGVIWLVARIGSPETATAPEPRNRATVSDRNDVRDPAGVR
jgi:putative copper resistance protein D